MVEDSTQEVLKFRLCFLVSDLYTLLYVLCFGELAKGKKMRTRYYIWTLLFLATEATAQAMQLNIQVQSRPISVCKQKHGVSCLAALARAEGGSSSEIIAEQERGECVKKSVAAVVGSWIVDNFKRLVLPRSTQD